MHYRRSQSRRHRASGLSGGGLQVIMKEQGMRRVAVLGGVRILLPLAYGLRRMSNLDMLSAALGG